MGRKKFPDVKDGLGIKISVPNLKEEEAIDDALMAYNLSCVSLSQGEPFVKFCRCAKDGAGNLVGGILAYSALWNILAIDTLWVKEEYRKMGIGGKLLREVEQEAASHGCYMAQLNTYDFQGIDFYLSKGYRIFGKLPESPKGHVQYYLYKYLKNN